MKLYSIALLLTLIALLAACDNPGSSGSGQSQYQLQILTSSLPTGTAGTAYSIALDADGGSGMGYSWTVSSGALPPGLILTSGTPSAVLSGTPTQTGQFSFDVTVTDSDGRTASQPLQITVAAAPQQLNIVTTTLPTGIDGVLYSETVTAAGGTGSGYTWTVSAGVLPSGLGLTSGTPSAVIDGVPTTYGTFSFTVEVADSAGNTASAALKIDVYGYYGTPVGSSRVYLLDCSSSMAGNRIASLRAEIATQLQSLTSSDDFDIMVFRDSVQVMWGAVLPATSGNVAAAISWLNGPATNPGSIADTGLALQTACQTYPSTLDDLLLYTDSAPAGTMSASQVLANFPTWWQAFANCQLTGVAIGTTAAAFVQQLVALAGGSYVYVSW